MTGNDHLKALVGNMAFDLSETRAQNDIMRELLVELGRMIPVEGLQRFREKFEAIGIKLVAPQNGSDAPPPEPDVRAAQA